jgi:hypothetical protein
MHSTQTITHSLAQEVEDVNWSITRRMPCLHDLLLLMRACAHAGSENTTIVDVCIEYLEAADAGDTAAVVAKWDKHLPPMASNVDVRVTNVPPYLRKMVKVHESYIVSEYKKAHPDEPDAGSRAKVRLPLAWDAASP